MHWATSIVGGFTNAGVDQIGRGLEKSGARLSPARWVSTFFIRSSFSIEMNCVGAKAAHEQHGTPSWDAVVRSNGSHERAAPC